MANGHGGARPGAGRKSNAVKYERPINRAEKRVADHLPAVVDNLVKLADGGYERVTERWEPAGTVMRDTLARNADGSIALDDKGKPIRSKEQVYPDLPPDELVLVQRTMEIADSDREANKYLFDRIAGKPTVRTELTGADGGPIEVDGLSDEQRAERIAALLDAARARGARPPAAGGEPD